MVFPGPFFCSKPGQAMEEEVRRPVALLRGRQCWFSHFSLLLCILELFSQDLSAIVVTGHCQRTRFAVMLSKSSGHHQTLIQPRIEINASVH